MPDKPSRLIRSKRRGALAAWALLMLGALACGRDPQPVVHVVATLTATTRPSETPRPTATPTVIFTPTPSPTPAGWETVTDGAQIRRMVGSYRGYTGDVFALRLDPARVDVQLRYDHTQPRNVAQWFDDEQPLAALNAGFFARDFTPVGLWVIDGVTYGRGHHLMQGEFRVSGAGLAIRQANQRYQNDGTRIIASVESYPLLIVPGGRINPCLKRTLWLERMGGRCFSSSARAERTVVGVDGAGYLLFVLVPTDVFTLSGLADWLVQSDLNLVVALNLDGGSSSGMLVRNGAGVWGADSGREVPGALIVTPKVLGVQGGISP